MRNAPNVLLIGAASRAVGKTEFACAVIREMSPLRPVIGVKITTLREDSVAGCPHGRQGCGVCCSLQDKFSLVEERERGTGKDTSRMLEAGAHQVYWLRVQEEYLTEGVNALLRVLSPSAAVVCESNSARKALLPGAFLVIRDAHGNMKASCAAVLSAADRVIVFDGCRLDFSPERCHFVHGRWTVPMLASGVVLAGGQSRRMGQNKSLLPYRDSTLIEHVLSQLRPFVEELIIGANDASPYESLRVRVVRDEIGGRGPLMGVLSCVRAATYDPVFVTACDIPELPPDLIREMLRRVARPRGNSSVFNAHCGNSAVFNAHCDNSAVSNAHCGNSSVSNAHLGDDDGRRDACGSHSVALGASPFDANCDYDYDRGDADVVLPMAAGRLQPLPAAFHRRIVAAATDILSSGGRRLVDLCHRAELRVVSLPPSHTSWYRNINTPDEYRELLRQDCL